ncbi:MAG TPA: Ig-like domain-containing protein, partial [Candidatus Synoicihabitans sp.]|nr:Ig-like domain-containing protein [Candidatus Synoicihabitans sp.]
MIPSRAVRHFIVLVLAVILPTVAIAGTTQFRVLFDTDADGTTGCTVGGMAGTEQVLLTQISNDDTNPRVTRIQRQVCTAGVLGAPIDLDTTEWPATWREADRQMTFETRIPFAAFDSVGVPPVMRLGFDATRNTDVHSALENEDGTPARFPQTPGKRRAARSGGDPRVIIMDGQTEDWTGVTPILSGIAANGTQALRLVRILSFANERDGNIYFAASIRIASDSPFADDDTFFREQNAPTLAVPAPGVLQNDSDPNGQPLTAIKVGEPNRGTVTLNPDGSFTYTPSNPASTGIDQFEYKAVTGSEESNVARVLVKVNTDDGPPPGGPQNDAYSTPEDTILNVPAPGVLANDPEVGAARFAQLVSGPSRGTLTLNANGSFTYKPNGGFFGTDSFVYSLNVPG